MDVGYLFHVSMSFVLITLFVNLRCVFGSRLARCVWLGMRVVVVACLWAFG